MGAQAVRLSNVDINNALKNKDFEILFQPIFDLSNGALARVETFVRWRHAALGVLPPGAFISFFESQGRMSELTRYVLNEAVTHYKEWRGPYAPGFSINLALSDLGDEAFASHFSVLLRDHDFPPELVTLECPMPPVDQDLEVASRNFERLSDTGARLAIEVRGRANEFLSKIDPFPFDEIKTGGAAILRFARTVRGPGLSAISELLELANTTNAAITAVGVEDQASLSALRSLGFAAAQGNHLGKVGAINNFTPSRVNEVRDLLGLEQLSKDDLASMFRTSTAELQTKSEKQSSPVEKDAETEKITQFPAKAHSQGDLARTADDDNLLDRLAARIAETEAPAPTPKKTDRKRKAAAIARARKRAALEAKARDEENPAHDLQARLSEEFDLEKAEETSHGDTTIEAANITKAKVTPEENSDKTPQTKTAPKKSKSSSRPKTKATGNIARPPQPTAKEKTAAATNAAGDEKNTTLKPEASPEKPVSQEAAADEKPKKTTAKHKTTSTKKPQTKTPPVKKAATQKPATAKKTSPKTADVVTAAEKERIVVEGSVSKNAVSETEQEVDQAFTAAMPVGAAAAQFLPIFQIGPERPTPVSAAQPAQQLSEIEVVDPAQLSIERVAAEEAAKSVTAPAQEAVAKKPARSKPAKSAGFLKAAAQKIETPRENVPAAVAAIDADHSPAEELESVWIDATDGIEEDLENARPRRANKNFLTRRYQIPQWPNHFWPRSWKRAWKRRAAYRAELNAE